MFVTVGDLNVHVLVDGPPGAPVLLLLHSLGTCNAIWEHQARALASGFRVVRPDLRGHGLSGVTPGPGSIDRFASDALGLLDALGVESAHVAGISIGGMIAQAIAIAAPARVLSLILCDTALAIPTAASWHDRAAAVRASGLEPMIETIVARWITAPSFDTPAALGLRAMLRRTATEGYAAAAEAIAGSDLTNAAAGIEVPTLVLVGEHDQATDVSTAERLAATIRDSRLVVIPGAAHIPTVEQPDAVLDAMRDFLCPPPADYYDAGMAVRRQVLGSAHVDRATAAITSLDAPFQHFITRTAWGGVWTRPGLDRRTRSLLTLAMMAALGHEEEFALHVRAMRNTGATADDLAEVLIQVAAYGGIPAANSAVRVAKRTLADMKSADPSSGKPKPHIGAEAAASWFEER